MGNVRTAFTNIGNAQTPYTQVQSSFYYPFGMRLARLEGSEANKYLYNSKELEDDNGLYTLDYGARRYLPWLGRWGSMDPADEFHSPYVYVGNNPVNLVDPDGRQVDWLNGISTFFSSTKSSFDNWFESTFNYGDEISENRGIDEKEDMTDFTNKKISIPTENIYVTQSYGKNSTISENTFFYGSHSLTTQGSYISTGIDFNLSPLLYLHSAVIVYLLGILLIQIYQELPELSVLAFSE